MKRTVWLWELVGFGVTSFFGTILHFLYEWLGKPMWFAPFSSVNESIWEHMKLLFWPMLIYAIVQSFFFRDRDDFWSIKLRGILLGITLIPVIYYTYSGVLGHSVDFINISIFFVAAAIVYFYESRRFYEEETLPMSPIYSIAILIALGVLFAFFTFATPRLGIFRDPVSGKYGI